MIVQVNEQAVETTTGITILDLLKQLDLTTRHIAVEVNLNIVPFENHSDTILYDGDQLEVVTLVGGG
ncbi:MAG: sulfur carrier protein ThiS [Planctomycetes bacterium]|nr:sulfur carrier protein ThiS [Planctomycetota bacterium]